MIKFKHKTYELRYNSKFYKGDIIKTYKTIFTENEINKIVYDLSVKDDNLKKMKMKEYKEYEKISKYLKWALLGLSIYFILVGLLVFVPFLVIIYVVNLVIVESKKGATDTLVVPTDKNDLIDLYNGKYLNNDNKSLYTYVSLDFFNNQKLVYEYIYFKACTSQCEGNVNYYWKKEQEVALIFLNSLEEIEFTSAGIMLKGNGYFPRYNGNEYYSYPYAFIPSCIENYDEVLEIFKSLKISNLNI